MYYSKTQSAEGPVLYCCFIKADSLCFRPQVPLAHRELRAGVLFQPLCLLESSFTASQEIHIGKTGSTEGETLSYNEIKHRQEGCPKNINLNYQSWKKMDYFLLFTPTICMYIDSSLVHECSRVLKIYIPHSTHTTTDI